MRAAASPMIWSWWVIQFLDELVVLERLAATRSVAVDALDGFEDVKEPLAVVAHLHRDGFVEHALAHAGSQTVGGDDIDRAAEQVRQVHDQAAEVQQASARLQVDEEINVAGGVRLATGHGTEHADVVRTMPPGEFKDLLAATSDLIRGISGCSDRAWHVGRFTSGLGGVAAMLTSGGTGRYLSGSSGARCEPTRQITKPHERNRRISTGSGAAEDALLLIGTTKEVLETTARFMLTTLNNPSKGRPSLGIFSTTPEPHSICYPERSRHGLDSKDSPGDLRRPVKVAKAVNELRDKTGRPNGHAGCGEPHDPALVTGAAVTRPTS
jgi:hypothetical protein